MEKLVKKIATLLLCCLSVALSTGLAQEMPFSTGDGFEGRGYSPVYGSNIVENNPGNGFVFDVYNDVTDVAVSVPADAAGSYMAAFAAPIPLSVATAEGNQITFTCSTKSDKDFILRTTNDKTSTVGWSGGSQNTYMKSLNLIIMSNNIKIN